MPATLALLLGFLLPPAVASAQAGAEAVTLRASDTSLTFGDRVTLSGEITPAVAGETVRVLDDSDAVVDTATTDASGAFELTLVPEGTHTFRASWGSAMSEEVTVAVRAVVASVRITPVRLFDDVVVHGFAEPARPGALVRITLVRGGRVVDEAEVEMGAAGGFRATFRVMTPGTYRARASYTATDLRRDAGASRAGVTPLPALRSGAHGVFVELLERRLRELHYRLAGATDGDYDRRTADAVVAFHKVQRMPRTFSVNETTWRALADPRIPRARHDWRGLHIEVDQTRQVLYTVEDGEVTNVLHVSTGAGGATRDGTFRVYRKLAGFSPNRLYYPSYFDGLRALHGWTEVPTYAASHGCVRIPYWNAIWVYEIAAYGTRVSIYH